MSHEPRSGASITSTTSIQYPDSIIPKTEEGISLIFHEEIPYKITEIPYYILMNKAPFQRIRSKALIITSSKLTATSWKRADVSNSNWHKIKIQSLLGPSRT
jgi:hypothetical protein